MCAVPDLVRKLIGFKKYLQIVCNGKDHWMKSVLVVQDGTVKVRKLLVICDIKNIEDYFCACKDDKVTHKVLTKKEHESSM